MDMVREAWVAGSAPLAASYGLVVFEDDPVSAPVLERMLGPAGVEQHVARIPFPPADGDPDVFAGMLREAAASILPSDPPPVIGFACTTGAVMLGETRLRSAVARPGCWIDIVTPMDAVIEALAVLGARHVCVVSPYAQDESRMVAERLAVAGFVVPRVGYFAAGDAAITAIDGDSIVAAARHGLAAAPADALFLSCTGMRSTPLIALLEAELEVPVLTSLQVMAWRIAAMLRVPLAGPGRLFGLPIEAGA